MPDGNEATRWRPRRRRRARRGGGHDQRDFEARAEAIGHELLGLARSLWRCRWPDQDPEPGTPPLELSVRLPLASSGGDSRVLASRLLADIVSALDAHSRPDGFREGRVYCHLCESAECEHSAPQDPKMVFAGYGINGKPEWKDLSQVLLQAGEPRVHLLFGDRPVVLCLVQDGDGLCSKQMAAFGRDSRTHHILGQVVAGYFTTPGGRGSAWDRWAISVQAVEYRTRRGVPELGMNVVGAALGALGVEGILVQVRDEALYAALAQARVRMGSIARGARDPATLEWYGRNFEPGVREALHQLARFIQRASVQQRSRTRHAREERAHGDRPLAAALKDLHGARVGDFHLDESARTVAVIGPHRRTHIFSLDGRLVTSINYEGEEIRRKLRTGRWRPARPEEILTIREKVRALEAAVETGLPPGASGQGLPRQDSARADREGPTGNP
ncbi:MAG: hypothetical protein HYU36_17485 [Planctomycetes bacterium]|nr:hypothetical protein [Planctomycetota bacterium]